MSKTFRRLSHRITRIIAPMVWDLVGRGLKYTQAFASVRSPQIEFHTMLGRRDLIPYLVGMKSVMRFLSDFKVGLVVHSDDSLSEDHKQLLWTHFPGINVIQAPMAEERCGRVFGFDSFAHHQRTVYLSWRRLIDTQLFRNCDKVINIDADVLCLNDPVELKDWIVSGQTPFVLGQTNGQSTPDKLDGRSWNIVNATDEQLKSHPIQTRFLKKLPTISKSVGLPLRFLDGGCAGLHGHHNELAIEDVQKIVECASRLGLPMDEWGAEQCTVVYLISAKGGRRLEPTTNFNFFPDRRIDLPAAQLVHFVGLARYNRWIYPRLANQVVTQLR